MSRTATTTCPPAPGRRLSPFSCSVRPCVGHVVVVFALLWLLWRLVLPYGAGSFALVALLLLWRRVHPGSFDRMLLSPVLSGLRRRAVRRSWPEVAERCGLAPDEPPLVRSLRRNWPRIELVVRPRMGQTYLDFEKAAEAVRLAVGAAQIRVEPSGVRDISMTLTFGDALSAPFEAAVPPTYGDDSLAHVSLGRRADGDVWKLPLGPHTLVAGTSGSGKGSLFWSFAFALAPAVRTGTVQLHGIDLKGGMEIRMGEGLFTTIATTPVEAVVSLERLVDWMQKRTTSYAGRLRSHQPSVDEPLHVVMVDELAALTAYCPDRELQRRAEQAINLLCSQGRAPGFMVFACLQDPRKEVIPSRGLFTQMIGLRLKDLSETSMVLGEMAVLSGAHCHRITRSVPGTGYVIPEDGGHPIRVRAGFASDEVIRDVATRFAAPVRVQLETDELQAELEARHVRRSRSVGGAT